jgi:hypothetical protein
MTGMTNATNYAQMKLRGRPQETSTKSKQKPEVNRRYEFLAKKLRKLAKDRLKDDFRHFYYGSISGKRERKNN